MRLSGLYPLRNYGWPLPRTTKKAHRRGRSIGLQAVAAAGSGAAHDAGNKLSRLLESVRSKAFSAGALQTPQALATSSADVLTAVALSAFAGAEMEAAASAARLVAIGVGAAEAGAGQCRSRPFMPELDPTVDAVP